MTSFIRPGLSPTTDLKYRFTPSAVSRCAIQAELVSTIWSEQELGADSHDLRIRHGKILLRSQLKFIPQPERETQVRDGRALRLFASPFFARMRP